MRWPRVETVMGGLVTLSLLWSPGGAWGQDYPTKPVEIVVPFVPGGGSDLISRLVADYLGKKWGQPILVRSEERRVGKECRL